MQRSCHWGRRAGKCLLLVLAAGCAEPAPARSPTVVVAPPEAEPTPAAELPPSVDCSPVPRPARPIRPVAEVPVSEGDPTGGRFALQDAVVGLNGSFPLIAEIATELGTLRCELWEQSAPVTVANFVGLARGIRPFREPDGEWVRRPAYDGLTFHRRIPHFVIQGGDPRGTGAGDPGYVIPDEIDESIAPDRRGLLYMAHRGPNTGGMQFFVLDGPAPHIAGSYTVFGECAPDETIRAIADAPDRVIIESVKIAATPGCR